MANSLSVRAYMGGDGDVARFIRELKEQAGFETWAEFAREAGVLASSLSNWQMGNFEASGANLVKLIWAAQKKREDALIRAAAATNPNGAEARIAAYHELVEALGLADGQQMVQQPPQALSTAAAELIAEIRQHLLAGNDEFDARLARLEAAQAREGHPPSQSEDADVSEPREVQES